MAADDVVDVPGRSATDVDSVETVDQRAQPGGRLQAGQGLAGTRVCAIAEAEVSSGVAADVEGVRVGRVRDEDARARRNGDAGDVSVTPGQPSEGAQRRLIAEDLVDGVGDQAQVVLE
jgi:hypothetical protein